MSLEGFMIILAVIAGFITLPMVLLLCRVVWDHPVVGALLAVPVWIGAYAQRPHSCIVGEHCGARLSSIVFVFVFCIATVISAAALAGFGRRLHARARARAGLPNIPTARVRR